MKNAVFTTSRGTEVTLRNISIPLTLDILQAAINLVDKVEIADAKVAGELDRTLGIQLHTPIMAGGALGLYVTPVKELDDESETEADAMSAEANLDTPVFTSETEGNQTLMSEESPMVKNTIIPVDLDKILTGADQVEDQAGFIKDTARNIIDEKLPSDVPEEVKNQLAGFLEGAILEAADRRDAGTPPDFSVPVPEGYYRCKGCGFFHELPEPSDEE